MVFDLVAATNSFICRRKLRLPGEFHLYPSEASVVVEEDGRRVVKGNCLRDTYLRCVGQEGIPPDSHSQRVMEMGKAAEERLKNNWMQMGILEDYHARFQNPEYKISGEIDCIIRAPEDGQLFGVEIKSFYGYYASKEIEGNRSQAGRPKFSHLLQTLIYAYELRNIVNYFELFYVERGDGGYKSFKISVAPDELEDGTIVYRPYIDNVLVTSFTMTDVYDRYALALHCIEAEQIPDKEFELYYSNDRIEEEHTAGRLSDSKYDDFKHVHKKTGKVTYHESKRPGDWNCAYCKYKSFCYEDLAC